MVRIEVITTDVATEQIILEGQEEMCFFFIWKIGVRRHKGQGVREVLTVLLQATLVSPLAHVLTYAQTNPLPFICFSCKSRCVWIKLCTFVWMCSKKKVVPYLVWVVEGEILEATHFWRPCIFCKAGAACLLLLAAWPFKNSLWCSLDSGNIACDTQVLKRRAFRSGHRFSNNRLFVSMCVCVRERERMRETKHYWQISNI